MKGYELLLGIGALVVGAAIVKRERDKSLPFRCGSAIPTQLHGLKKEAKKYKGFRNFSADYSLNLMRGRYWHITDNPDFRLRKEYSPRDLSSMAAGFTGPPGLMVSYTPEVWAEYFPNRKYSVEVDLGAATKKDYNIVNRGFGHEIFVKNLDKVKIGGVISIEQAIEDSDKYNEEVIPQSESDLKCFWDLSLEQDC